MQTVDMAMAKACKLGLTLSRETKFTGPCTTQIALANPLSKIQHRELAQSNDIRCTVTCTKLVKDKSSYQPELQKGKTRQLPRIE